MCGVKEPALLPKGAEYTKVQMGGYKRKTDRTLRFTPELMEQIRDKLRKGESKRSIAKDLGVAESSLRKRLKSNTIPTSLGRFRPTFSVEMQEALATHIRKLNKQFYGITLKELQSIAYQFAEQAKVKHSFNTEKKVVGKRWLKTFCERHNIVVRTPEKTSLARAIGFNRPQVNRFFQNLKECIEKYGIQARSIFNMDETGMLTVPNKIPKVLAPKGQRNVGKVVSGERGTLITAVCCANAAGFYVPPALIFPRKREKKELLHGAPTGTILMVSDTGFINTDLFLKWLQHFNEYVRPSNDNPVLLLLDNHSSHISLPAITFCRSNGIHLLSIPPHSSHKLQPLDVGFFGPLKNSYAQEADKWMVCNPGKTITQCEVATLFGNAYNRVASLEKAMKSFESAGVWPYNPDTFGEEEFCPAAVTDQPANVEIVLEDAELLQQLTTPTTPRVLSICETNVTAATGMEELVIEDPGMLQQLIETPKVALRIRDIVSQEFPEAAVDSEYPSTASTTAPETLKATSDVGDDTVSIAIDGDNHTVMIPHPPPPLGQNFKSPLQNICSNENPGPSSPFLATLESIRPTPKCNRNDAKRKRISKKSEILTSSPYKDDLIEKTKTPQAKKGQESCF
ncbi:hypothetical protein NQ318_015788 [Aromia moschata]|uniref:HTH CENPB-type domain-containing protein n=1 Tax=Aromia moschata TaxID=1265417 RepID=A0AAV8X8I1_9CUCU|nr:hypothetical protein NQ318_015788 [Aromia moschata]